jgi:hypothetical protein
MVQPWVHERTVAAPEDDCIAAVMRVNHAGITFFGPIPDEVRRRLYG